MVGNMRTFNIPRSFAMRRWYFASAAVLGLAALAVLGGKLFSDDKADANAPAGSKIAKSKIDKVVVYPNSALVTREVDVPEGNGLAELVVAPMPEQIIPSTMFSEAAEGIRVLTTRFSTRQVLEDTSEERRKLEAEQEKYQVIAAKIESEMNSCTTNMQMIAKLEATAQNNKLTGDEVIAMAKYVM